MKIAAIVALLVLLSGTAEAVCRRDLTNTNRTGEAEMPLAQLCFQCRNLYQFPGDFRNFGFNWIVVGIGTEGGPGTLWTGHAAYQRVHENAVINRNPTRLANPICNRMGQCATVTVLTYHDIIFRIEAGIRVMVSQGIDHWQVQVTAADGDTVSSNTYYPGQSSLPVPQNRIIDPKLGGPCLDNFGELRPRFDSTGGGLQTQSWHLYPERWQYKTITRSCGTATLSTGERKRTCGWF